MYAEVGIACLCWGEAQVLRRLYCRDLLCAFRGKQKSMS